MRIYPHLMMVGYSWLAFFFVGERSNHLNNFQGKIVVITGASGGIGAEAAQLIAKQGAIPILIARRADMLQKVTADIPSKCECIVADVTDDVQVYAVVTQIIEKYGK